MHCRVRGWMLAWRPCGGWVGTSSSRYLRAQYTGRINHMGLGSVFWSRSCFAGSCGGAPLSIVRPYIEVQVRPA